MRRDYNVRRINPRPGYEFVEVRKVDLGTHLEPVEREYEDAWGRYFPKVKRLNRKSVEFFHEIHPEYKYKKTVIVFRFQKKKDARRKDKYE